jgi:polygalacturonase
MFNGDGLTNIAFTGAGTIDGGGHFITGNPKSGQADKLISLTRCTNLTVSGITLKRGGHFGMLINGCNGVTSDHLNIQTASDRDGWNIINTQNITITNITVASNDDALVFKSDWALGQRFPQGNVTVTGAHLSAGCCNALMFGSETCSDFTNYRFSDITITHAGKSGLGMVSMDGAHISNVRYSNVTMSGTASPVMLKIGARHRCGDSPGVGSISDIHYDTVTGTKAGGFSPTIWGQPGHQVSNVSFTGVNLTLPGGHGAMGTGVPSDNGDYNPNSIGTRPAYGWYLHQVSGITFTSSSVRFTANDARPAVLANTGSGITFDHFTLQSGTGSPFDIGFQNVTGYCVTAGTTTGGKAPRVNATGSTAGC